MRLALAEARKGIRRGQTPFGACIVKGKTVIAVAHNSVWKDTDPSAHAEINAIRIACRKLKTVDLGGCVLYSTCEPCPMCFSACHWARITQVVWGCRISDARRLGFNELLISSRKMKEAGRSPVSVLRDFMRGDCLRIFKEWKKLSTSLPY